MRVVNRPKSCARIPSVFSIAALALVASATATAACGSRGPLDDYGPLDAAASAADSASTDAPDAAATPDAADAARPGGGSIVGCGICLVSRCGQGFLACAQSAACRQTFQCVIGDCLVGGSPDVSCLLKCATGDPAGALQMLTIFQCVSSTCGADCVPLIQGALGGLGGGGGGPPTRDAAPPRRTRSQPFAQAVSRHWPELCAPEPDASDPAAR